MLGREDEPDTTHRDVDLDAELDALMRQNFGYLQQIRVRRLSDRLARHGPLAIRHTRPGFSRDRLSISLDDDSTLKLKLFWPLKATLSSLVSIRWEDDIGWVVIGRSTRGDQVTSYAWMASVVPSGGGY